MFFYVCGGSSVRIYVAIMMMAFSFMIQAQTAPPIRGQITADSRWSDYVRIDGDIIIQKGVTVSIEPGTRIVIKARKDKTGRGIDSERIEITVLGKLIAAGTPDKKIRFISSRPSPQMGDWYGIIFKNLNEMSILDHCTVEYAYKGVTCYGSSPEIRNSELQFNFFAGLSAEIHAQPRILNTILMGNGYAGLSCELAAYPILEGCIITQNTNGIIVFDRSQPDLGSISSNPQGSRGLNQIFNNFEVDFYNQSSKDILAQNNMWNSESIFEINNRIVDGLDNQVDGRVRIEPVLRSGRIASNNRPVPRRNDVIVESTPPRRETQPTVSSDLAQNTAGVNTQPSETTTENAVTAVDDALLAANGQAATGDSAAARFAGEPYQISSLKTESQSASQRIDDSTFLTQESLSVFKEEPLSPSASQPTNVSRNMSRTDSEPVVRVIEPVREGLLDTGKRRYKLRVKAQYPEIYRRTGYEGKVFMEVIVGRDGSVESYRVLRSDGEHFTESALQAVKGMQYQPGTFRGNPIKFRIIEPFVFKLKG